MKLLKDIYSSMSALSALITIGGIIAILDLSEKLKPFGIDIPKLAKSHPYIASTLILIFIILFIWNDVSKKKKEEKRIQEAIDAEKRRNKEIEKQRIEKENEMYEKFATFFHEKFPDNVECGPSSVSSLYSEVFLENKLAIPYSKRFMIELDKRGLAKLEISRNGNYILKKIKW